MSSSTKPPGKHHPGWLFEGAVLVAAFSSLLCITALAQYAPSTAFYLVKFSVAQWTPFPFLATSHQWQEDAWQHWEAKYLVRLQAKTLAGNTDSAILDIPIVEVQQFESPATLLNHIESTYGMDWRRKPLLLKGLWDVEELRSNITRCLSKAGLLREELTIPYFQDARVIGALTPNDVAPVKDIVANITLRGAPHKIGTQFLIRTYPELIQEVAPIDIVTELFGDRFQPKNVVGAWGLPFLPATTTVPLFVAGSQFASDNNSNDEDREASNSSPPPFTGLHCEPIGNVAVQLEGEKQWTLVSPEYSLLIRPSASPDGRAFFVSGLSSDKEMEAIPRYYATTATGDALWVPTWTWHRVDYRMSRRDDSSDSGNGEGNLEETTGQIAIGASLFHLRPWDLIGNNPLFAVLVVPNLLKEIFRFKTQ